MSYALTANWFTLWPDNPEPNSDPQLPADVVGSAASGLDLAAEITLKLYEQKADTARNYFLQSETLPEAALSPQNRRALALHEEWYAEPDDLGEAWWAEFEEELRQNRLNFRVIDV
jgi:hypothetical protein